MKTKGLFENERRTAYQICNDWEFKYLFGRDTEECKKALMAVLNMILDRKEDPIISIELKNPVIIGEELDLKDSTLDIRAEASSGELIDIEMQNGGLKFYVNRSIYYGGRLINLALDSGENYDKLKKSIVISVIKGRLFKETKEVHSMFRPMEVRKGWELSDKIEWHFIEIDKVDASKAVKEMSAVEQFATYMKYANDSSQEELITQLLKYGGEEINMTEHIFREMTEDEKLAERLEDKKRFVLAQNTAIYAAEKRGLEQGLEEGKLFTARKLKASGMSDEQIAEIIELDIDVIRKI